MDKILDALADELAGRVLEKLFETERMKAFLANQIFPQIKLEQIEGLTAFITNRAGEYVEEAMQNFTVDPDDIEGFDKAVENVIDNGTLEVSFRS